MQQKADNKIALAVDSARTKTNVVRAKPSRKNLTFAVGDFKKIALLMLPCPKTM